MVASGVSSPQGPGWAARRAPRWALAAAVIWATAGLNQARAQTVSDEPAVVYPGAQFNFALSVRDVPQMRAFYQADLALPDRFLLRRVFATDPSTGNLVGELINPAQLDNNPAQGGLGCTRAGDVYSGCSVDPTAGVLGPFAVTLLNVGGAQVVRVDRSGGEPSWEAVFHVEVLVTSPYTCATSGAAVATFRPEFPDPEVTDTATCSEPQPVQSLQGTPGVVLTQRAAPPRVESWSWQAQINGNPVPIASELPVICRPASACAEGDPNQRLRITTRPGGAQAEVLNAPADPPPGALGVAIDTIYEGQTYTDVVTLTIQEQAPALLRVDAPSGLVHGIDQLIPLNVSAAENAQGGLEPRQGASWDVQVVSPPSPPGLNPSAWLVNPTAQSTGLRVPASDASFLMGQPMTVRVTAVPRIAGAAADNSVDLTIHPGPVQSCFVVASPTTATWGEAVSLQVRRQVGTQPPEDLAIHATWSVSGGGTVEAGPAGRASFVAPRRAALSTITANFGNSPECTNPTAQLQIETVGQVRLTLTAPRSRARAGEVLGFEAAAISPQAERLPDIEVTLQSTGLKLVGSDTPAGGRTLRPVSSAHATTALPVLVRLGAGCGRQRATLVGRVGGEVVARSEEIELTVLCDPEFFEATVFGKVFDDINGDGEQQEGERGLPGVMVALSSSVYAITDDQGRYSIPQLEPGRVAVKVDVNTLPVGAQVVGLETRAVTLTPGMFTRVNFAVHTLRLSEQSAARFVAEGSGVRLGPEGLVYRAWLEGAPNWHLSARRGDRVVEGVWDQGRWRVDLPLLPEQAKWSLVVRDEAGRVSAYAFGVHVYEREGDRLVLPWGPRLLARWGVPVSGEVSRRSGYHLRAEVYAPGTVAASLQREGTPCAMEVEEEDVAEQPKVLECALPVSAESRALLVTFDAAPDPRGDDPPPLVVAVPVQPREREHFVVGLATYEMGCDPSPRGLNLRTCLGDGGGSFFYTGQLGALQLTAGMALRARDQFRSLRRWETAEGVFDTLLGSDPTRVFRDLDPEQYYPTYGDGSVVVDERESGGRFFFRLQHGDDFLRWGGVRTGIGTGEDEVEVGRYQRALYGLGGRYTLQHTTEGGTPLGLSAKIFGAHPETASARDRFTVTGGSLYFLSHRPVVQGSVRVTLEILDEVSGWVMRRVELTEGIDFETDPYGGRLHLNPALPYQFWGRSLTVEGPGGNTGQLIVEYEYVPSFGSAGALAAGARVLTRAGPVALGGTYVTEIGNAGDPTYHLAGATARLHLGEWLWGEVDYAYSWGGSHAMFTSFDGGLRGTDLGVGQGEGHAVGAELGTEVGGVTARAYGRFYDAGFTDSRRAAGDEQWQVGATASAKLPSDTGLWLQADHQSRRPVSSAGSVARTTAVLGASQKLGWLELGLEGRFLQQRSELEATPLESNSFLLGAQAGVRFTEHALVYVRRRQEVTAPFFGGTALGATVNIEGWSFAGELGTDDDLTFFGRLTGGMPVDEETQLYAGYVRASRVGLGLGLLDPEPAHRLITGGRRRTRTGTILFAESAIEEAGPLPSSPGPYRSMQTVGGQIPLSKQLALTVSYQRSALRTELNSAGETDSAGEPKRPGERNSGSVGILWATDFLRIDTSADLRVESLGEAGEVVQVGGQGRVEWLASKDLTFALAGRGAATWGAGVLTGGGVAGAAERHAWEGSAGFAFRPVHTDWLNAFGRYAVVGEDETLAPGAMVPLPLRKISHTGALNLIFEVWGPLALGTKVAYRYTEAELLQLPNADGTGSVTGGPPVQDDALVGALRGDLHLNAMWDVTVEGRVCGSPLGGGGVSGGALVELNALLMGWLRLGAGYNFSDIATGSVRCNEPTARGVFVRAEAMY